MLVETLLLECRTRLDDVNKPYLWLDESIISWINEAQIEACRRARLISDSSLSVNVAIGTPSYDIPNGVIQIRKARLSLEDSTLCFVGSRDMDEDVSGWESHAGTPTSIITDIDSNMFTLYPKPIISDTLNLTVIREPSEIIDDSSVLEIPNRFHYALADWVLHRAYQVRDSETMDKNKSIEHLALFENEFGVRSSAKDEIFNIRQMPYSNTDGYY